jgi:hypothetical protein
MRSTSTAQPDPPPATGDDSAAYDIWVPAKQAAIVLAKPERWLREKCRAGHLPCHGEPRTGQVFLVPMTATEELAERSSTTGP